MKSDNPVRDYWREPRDASSPRHARFGQNSFELSTTEKERGREALGPPLLAWEQDTDFQRYPERQRLIPEIALDAIGAGQGGGGVLSSYSRASLGSLVLLQTMGAMVGVRGLQ